LGGVGLTFCLEATHVLEGLLDEHGVVPLLPLVKAPLKGLLDVARALDGVFGLEND
jgi:hypothetical protein